MISLQKKIMIDDFLLEEKRRLLRACSDVIILTEISKRGGLSAFDVIALFKEKYGELSTLYRKGGADDGL
jgi:hypothetical protein